MTAFVIDAVRTPRGRGSDKGALRGVAPIDLLGGLAAHLRERLALDTARVADATIGCVGQVGDQGGNVGRLALLAGGWSDRCPVGTINRFCASSLSAALGAGLRASADDAIAVAGGVEMMSRVPLGADRGALTHDLARQIAHGIVPIGVAADAIASRAGVTREECDAYAAESQRRAAHARSEGRFASIVPVRTGGATVLAEDETPRPGVTLERLAAFPPAFAELAGPYGGVLAEAGLAPVAAVHHAGNSPAPADGASLVVLASERAARDAGLTPRARIIAGAEVGDDRTLALTGVVAAIHRVLDRGGVGVGDVELFEINESFAGVMVHLQRLLAIDPERLNPNGGAIALGHALGATGAMLLGMAVDELERRRGRYAVVAISGAAGLASAALIERV